MHCNVCNKYRKPKKTKISLSPIKKHYVSLLFTVSVAKIYIKQIKIDLKKKNQLKY